MRISYSNVKTRIKALFTPSSYPLSHHEGCLQVNISHSSLSSLQNHITQMDKRESSSLSQYILSYFSHTHSLTNTLSHFFIDHPS